MITYGMGTIADLFGERVIYRNLVPCDDRLPSLKRAWRKAGLESLRIPRKTEMDYARVVAWMLRQAQEIDHPGVPLRELAYIGDTELLDRAAFRNLKQALDIPAWAFIANEKTDAPAETKIDGDVLLANRWAALLQYVMWLQEEGATLEVGTAVVVDMDKTLVGARGRNDHPVDLARVEGVERTVADILGGRFERESFVEAYNTLNQTEFYSFTADNQDYLAYTCLVISANLMSVQELVEDIRSGRMCTFAQFIRWADMKVSLGSDQGLVEIHQAVYARVTLGDPTPFKAFRRNEYLTTVARYGSLPEDAPVEERLAEEVCITYEVIEAVKWLRDRGAQLLCLSDKPDEASVPTQEQAVTAHKSLHQTPSHIVGEPVAFP